MAQADEGRVGVGTIVIPRNMPSGNTAITTATMERVGAGPAWCREVKTNNSMGYAYAASGFFCFKLVVCGHPRKR